MCNVPHGTIPMSYLFIKSGECRCVVMVITYSDSRFGMSLQTVNYDLQIRVDNSTNSLYIPNSAAQLKQPCGVSKTAVSEQIILQQVWVNTGRQ